MADKAIKKGAPKKFQSKELSNKERVEIALTNYIKAMGELEACVELEYIDNEKKKSLLNNASKFIEIEKNDNVTALSKSNKQNYDLSELLKNI